MSTTFADLGVPDDLAMHLARRSITEAFPIQAAALPDGLAGHDICGRAPTGSGKTLAFGLVLALRAGPAHPLRPSGLVLVPTRELAGQVAKELQLLATPQHRQVVAVYGGAGYEPQRRALRRGADILVATPGRLEDLIARRDVRLDNVGIAVIDEADRMADMGFLPAVGRVLDATPATRQTLLFSATLDGDVDVLVRRYQRDPRRHDVTVADDGASVNHVFWHAPRDRRVALTAELVEHHDRAIVFCRTRHGADRLTRQLRSTGLSAVAIHGNRTQSQRERALSEFISGRAQALVATDVAARGIHVDAVPCVVHFDPAADRKDYVHRSGRTGRAGLRGTVVTLVGNEHRPAVRALQRALGLPEQLEGEAGPAPAADPARRPARPASSQRRGGPRSGRPAGPSRQPRQRGRTRRAPAIGRRRPRR